MEVTVNSIKPFCSRNYDEKLEIAKAKTPTQKLNVGSRNRIKLSSTSIRLFNKCLHEAANIVEKHTFKKCSPYAAAIKDY